MDINWNIPPEALSPRDEAAEEARRLEADLARLGAKSVEAAPPTDSQESPPPTDSQESEESLPPELLERVYRVQAEHSPLVDSLAHRIIDLFAKVTDEDVRACAIGRALLILGDPNVVLAAYDIENAAMPQKGDRVQEENGAVGTVVAVRSLTEAIVKWDHEPRAMRSAIKYLSPVEPEK